MKWPYPRSIRQKLFAGVLLTTIFALAIAAVTMVAYELRNYRERVIEDLSTQGKLLGLASAPALQFIDRKLAADSLALIEARPRILAAAIYDAKGRLFASYNAAKEPNETRFPERAEPEGAQISGETIVLVQHVIDHNEVLGTIYLKARYQLYARIWQYAGILGTAMAIALIVSTLFSLWIQAKITGPILSITRLAQEVTEQRDYNLRAEKSTDDEIGYLVNAFNELLSEVGMRSAALELSNSQLQQQIFEREETDRALHQSERRHRSLVTALTSVVWVANRDGGFAEDQQPWDNYTGQTPGTHGNKGWLDAFHEDDRAIVEGAWNEARRQSVRLDCEARLWHAARNEYRYVSLRAVPIRESGNVLEWIGTADDIDDRHRAELEILRLNAELEQRVVDRTAELERANKELEAFSYSVSHDLRTPLRAIDGFSQALLEDYEKLLDDTGRDYLARVRVGAQRMGQLIDDLLKLARVSRTTLHKESIDLSLIAEDIVQDLRSANPDRVVNTRIGAGLLAFGDTHLLRIALENLLNNAWKYTGRCTSATIEFGLRSVDGQPCFFVKDNGAGFDMTYAGKLFGAFQRFHDAKDFPGTGVGLATVQRIIHRHGGTIWAESQINKGSMFYFALPMSGGHEDEH